MKIDIQLFGGRGSASKRGGGGGASQKIAAQIRELENDPLVRMVYPDGVPNVDKNQVINSSGSAKDVLVIGLDDSMDGSGTGIKQAFSNMREANSQEVVDKYKRLFERTAAVKINYPNLSGSEKQVNYMHSLYAQKVAEQMRATRKMVLQFERKTPGEGAKAFMNAVQGRLGGNPKNFSDAVKIFMNGAPTFVDQRLKKAKTAGEAIDIIQRTYIRG